MISGFSVVVTNWNGMDLLPTVLPNIVETAAGGAATLGVGHEVIVVDDRSTDGSRDYIRANFPGIRLALPEKNLGFQGASNLGFASAVHPIVVALNNDILLDAGSFPLLFRHFDDASVFAVSTRLLHWDRTTYLAGRRTAEWRRGHLRLVDEDAPLLSPSLFATGGAAAFRRGAFLELGGFDDLYHPFYWEDIDLCYRAWKRGLHTRYDPEIVMYHKHRATVGKKHSDGELRILTARNAYLFLWKNLTDPTLRRESLLWHPLLALADAARGRFRFLFALAGALRRAPRAIRANGRERQDVTATDREVWATISAAS